MLKAVHLKLSDYKLQQWKNGRGETKEIAVDEASPFRWRVSWAKVTESGPFSNYPDYDRRLVLLSGGLRIRHDSGPWRPLAPFQVHAFKGAMATEADVVALAEDFNVFTLVKKSRAGIYPTYFSAAEDMQFPVAAREHFIFCASGSVEVLDPNTSTEATLKAGETFRVTRDDDAEYLNLRARGIAARSVCLWILIH